MPPIIQTTEQILKVTRLTSLSFHSLSKSQNSCILGFPAKLNLKKHRTDFAGYLHTLMSIREPQVLHVFNLHFAR